MWSNLLDGSKETYGSPYSLYLSWLKTAQEQMKANMLDPQEIWQQWFETTIEGWRKVIEIKGDPLGLTTQWLKLMEEARAKMQTEGTFPTDPFTFFRQWYDATSETWSKVVGDVISNEQFLQVNSQFLEGYASFVKTFSRTSEEYFRNLQLPTRSDVARVAELVIAMEEKFDRLEDAFEDFEEKHQQAETGEALADLTGRLEEVENKLDTLPAALKRVTAIDGLTHRLDRVESKLDTLLAALEKLTRQKPTRTAKSPTAPRSKTRKAGEDSQRG